MSKTVVREANDEEIEEARAILREAYGQYESEFPAENWNPYMADIQDLEGRAEASDLIVAELDGKLVACVSYFPPGAKMTYPSDFFSESWPPEWSALRLLAVHPSARGSGVGRRLTEACIERARTDGAPAVGLHTTAPMSVARAMYERMGFEREPTYDFRPGPNLLVEAYRLILDPGSSR
ncbi:MAG: GNAT family N-acetyltransferase [Actinomycetota bacterium]